MAQSWDVKLSKLLSLVLRHKAAKLGLCIRSDGYVLMNELLAHKMFRNYTETDIMRVVSNNDKQRFLLHVDSSTGELMIRANQGHTIHLPDLELEPITDPSTYPTVLHGTYMRNWSSIQRQGLRRMKRNHIHFAQGEPGAEGVISGLRKSCEIMIFINLRAALEDGLEFFLSKNGVILCPGNEHGTLSPAYFSRVVRVRPREEIPFHQPSRPGRH